MKKELTGFILIGIAAIVVSIMFTVIISIYIYEPQIAELETQKMYYEIKLAECQQQNEVKILINDKWYSISRQYQDSYLILETSCDDFEVKILSE